MHRVEPVAKAYARALLELGAEGNVLDDLLEEVTALRRIFDETPMLLVFFQSPGISRSEKKALLDRVLGSRLSELVVNLLKVTIDRGRHLILRDILDDFVRLHHESKGYAEVSVTTAVPVREDVLERIRHALGGRLGREVLMEHRVDPALIGGLVLRHDDIVVDGSLRNELRGLGKRMKSIQLRSALVHED